MSTRYRWSAKRPRHCYSETRRYPRGPSIGTGGMLGDSSTHSSADPPLRVAPEGGAVQQAADELQPRPQRTPDLRPDQLAALLEIHRAVAGHLDRKARFTAIAHAPQKVVRARRVIVPLAGTDPSLLTGYAASGKLGSEMSRRRSSKSTGR